MITAFTCAHVLLESINNCEGSFVIGRVAVSQTEPLQIFTYLCTMKNIWYREQNVLKHVIWYRIWHRN